ncbi:MAG: tetratricopeptide repeat protein, partial [Nitrosomonadales bacterium]|nr:tetratricopeptide repeat protein [Nitrosomonadales bacterium]
REALALKPDYAEAHVNLGNVLQAQGKLDEAVESYRRALQSNPALADAHVNLGNALSEQGRLAEAVASYREALALKPNLTEALSNLLYLYAFTRLASPGQERDLAARWEYAALSDSERATAHQRFSGRSDRSPRTGRKLRVGVVSAELGQHSVAEFLEPFLEQVDRSRFHISLYPTTARPEPRAARFRELADEYKPLVWVPDREAAGLIRSDRIDILIDTTGHMKGCRLGIFAHRAAPVQCHYIGYHGTTGLTEMDWYIADGVLLPPAYDAHFCEHIWRLPRLRMAYRGDASLPESRWKPDPEGIIWLGSFNNLSKVSEQTLDLWARVMNALPQSRLLLKDIKTADPFIRQRIHSVLSRHGISGERIELAAWAPGWSAHMALYDRLDIALDTRPLNGETTAFDALWMGVPLVALEGDWIGGRQASTILAALGKPEWVAHDEAEYVAIVAALARDKAGRLSLRASQRALMAGSPLCDAQGLARILEAAFEEMFDRWWANTTGGSPPIHAKPA